MSRFFSVGWNYSIISSQIPGRNAIDFLLQLQDRYKNLIKRLRSVMNISPHQWLPSNHQCRRLSGDDHNRRLTHLIQGHSKRLWPHYGTALGTIQHCSVLALVHGKQNTEQELNSFKSQGKYPDRVIKWPEHTRSMTVRPGAISDSTTGRKDWHSYSKVQFGVGRFSNDLPGTGR